MRLRASGALVIAVVSFSSSKGLVLLAPLLLASVLHVADYGKFEAALALAGILAPLLVGGVNTAIPYFVLKLRQPEREASILLVSLLTIGVGAVLAGLGASFGRFSGIWEPLMLAAILAGQFIGSTLLKTSGRPAHASAFEGGLYVMMAGVAVAVAFLDVGEAAKVLWSSLGVYLFGIWCGLAARFLSAGYSLRDARVGLQAVLRYALPFVMPGMGMLLVVNGGRAVSGHLLGAESTAIYGLLFRLAAPAILVHQLLATIFFRELYASEARKLDRYFFYVITSVTAFGILGYLLLPSLLDGWIPMLKGLDERGRQVYLVLVAQTSLWVALALLEPIIARENHAWSQLSVLLFSALIGCVAAFSMAWHEKLNLLVLCQLQLLVFVLALSGLHTILWRSGIKLRRTILVAAVVVVGILAQQISNAFA